MYQITLKNGKYVFFEYMITGISKDTEKSIKVFLLGNGCTEVEYDTAEKRDAAYDRLVNRLEDHHYSVSQVLSQALKNWSETFAFKDNIVSQIVRAIKEKT